MGIQTEESAVHRKLSKSEDILENGKNSEGKEILEHRELKIDLSNVIQDLKNVDFRKVYWRWVFIFVVLNVCGIYGQYLAIFKSQWKTSFFAIATAFYSGLGVTMGVHRLWSHRTFKAKFPLRFILMIANSMAFQMDIYYWSKFHRVHHKYAETNADPHSAKRGFFFSHIGWWFIDYHPDFVKRFNEVDDSDLKADPIVMFQQKYYIPLCLTICYILPTFIPWYYWNEDPIYALLICGFNRHLFTIHVTYLVNSVAHWTGTKPYDATIYPSEHEVVSFLVIGEGWHNFHHVFPFDYRASEFSGNIKTNFTTQVIHLCEKLGLAYDLRKASDNVILQRKMRTGSLANGNKKN